MELLCIALDPAWTSSRWLTLHKEYTLLEIVALPNKWIHFRVVADDGRTPILVDSHLFSAPTQPLPASWSAVVTEGGMLTIGPARWLESGYWERFFDGDPVAVATFHEELEALSE